MTPQTLSPDQQRQKAKAADILHKRLTIYRNQRSVGIGRIVDNLLIFLLKHSSRPFFAGILAEGVAYPANEGGNGRLRWIQELSDQATRTYVPSPYAGRITYFQAIDSPPGVLPAPLGGWADVARGGIDLFRVPGDHTTIMKSPLLAHHLQACLQRTQRGASGNSRRQPEDTRRTATPQSAPVLPRTTVG